VKQWQHLTDQALIDACIAGHTEIYEVLVRRHEQKVFNVLYRFFGNYEISQDVSQEAFVTAWQKLATFGGRSAFSTWLCQIALNKARDRLRISKGHDALNDDLADHADSLFALVDQQPEHRAQQAGARKEIQTILDRLPANYREVLILKHLEEYDYEEIATMLNDTVGNVKVRIFRARRMFKMLYEK